RIYWVHMGVSYLSVSSVCTLLSFAGLQYWTIVSLENLKSQGRIGDNIISSGNLAHTLELLLASRATIALVVNLAINVFILLILSLKTIFFGELYPSESRKVVERLINYVIYKGTFLPLVVQPTIFQAGMWSTWMTVLCSLKMFQALARDRLERLNASPSATPWTYSRVFLSLLFVLFVDLFWIRMCFVIYQTFGSSSWLLFFEPASIAFETLQAIVVHGFQLLDIWLHHTAESSTSCQRSKFFDLSATGFLWEWKSIIIRNFGFFLDMMTLLMALGHYIHIWWLHGMAFQLVDAVLFLNIRALLSAIAKRVKGFIKLRIALGTLHGALPDATSEEIQAYNDECAICREPMAKAKRLSCNHLFHLACLRSWLDQGLNDVYSCPTCRKPLFVGRSEDEINPRSVDVSSDEQLARQISSGFEQQNTLVHAVPAGIFSNQMQNPLESGAWRGAGLDSSWLNTWPSQGLDGAGPSNAMRSVGLGRVQMMMRHLASVGETYAQTALEDAAWNLWPMNLSQASGSASPIPPTTAGVRFAGNTAGLHRMSRSASDNIANMLAMAETVREVLPHIPDELIFQDLQRTNSVTVTVNNLLQM
ncbi:Ubiquitin system component CUE, partial [Dillenia turbinata]